MIRIYTMRMFPIVILIWLVNVLPESAGEVPFPAALDAAAIVPLGLSDISREALMLGNDGPQANQALRRCRTYIDGWHGDGNYARTAIMWVLMDTRWRKARCQGESGKESSPT